MEVHLWLNRFLVKWIDLIVRSKKLMNMALSQRVLILEEELGTTLFIRDRAGLKLTDSALGLIRYCQMKNSQRPLSNFF